MAVDFDRERMLLLILVGQHDQLLEIAIEKILGGAVDVLVQIFRPVR